MDPGTVLIRADSNVAMGTGHVMRCLALAQAWQDAGGQAVMAMAEATPATEDKLRRENVEVVRLDVAGGAEDDAIRTASLAQQRQAAWATVDGYQFDPHYQAMLKSEGLRLMSIDDEGHGGPYSADLVLNQNAHAAEALYDQRAAHTRLLLGPDYAMLRRQFASWRNWQREIPATGHRILVTMGGSDPGNDGRGFAVQGMRRTARTCPMPVVFTSPL